MQHETIFVLGGDGFCGWPTALGLSKAGYRVVIVDNLSRRKIDVDLECDSLTPIAPISERLAAWKRVSGNVIDFIHCDVSLQFNRLCELLQDYRPKAVIHFAEQRSAPFSMKDAYRKRYTVNNNINATHNILCAIVETGVDTHLVHLGTMGVYGYGTAGMKIPEGYLNVQVETEQGLTALDILYPANPGSVYHMTKTQDALMFYYYNKNDGVRITDLHQGIVWGTNTDETLMDEQLINRFDYDGDYGTVLNRFLMQAAVGHPLTVHGVGGQTRAFIHIRDTVKCVRLAVENPPEHSERVKIFNQVTETHTVRELAGMVADITGAEIRYFKNPRKEDLENDLKVENKNFIALGLEPTVLSEGLAEEVVGIAKKYQHRVKMDKIICRSTWRKGMDVDVKGSTEPVAR